MPKTTEILDDVLKIIKLDSITESKIFAFIDGIIEKLDTNLKDAKVVLGGSGAKGTWLKSFDADIFVLFDYKKFKDKSDKISDILGIIVKKSFKNSKRLHGSRDYFRIKKGDFTFEIIPMLDIKKAGQAKNITDVSPLHSRWVLKHKKLSDQIKLTKQFCKAQRVYGAESYIRGFSGYVCEILTIHYSSFLNLIKNAVKWKSGEIIDVEKFYRRKDVFKELNQSKLISPLIIIDPVQKDRNAAAALSSEKFNIFKKACSGFIKMPSKKFFVEKLFTVNSILEKSTKGKTIFIIADPIKAKEDVAGTKLLKVFDYLKNNLISYGFNLLDADWQWDSKARALFYFTYDKNPLPTEYEVTGPPTSMKEHTASFRKKHKKTFVKKGIIYAIDKRKHTLPEKYLKNLIKDNYVSERVKSIMISQKK